MAVAVRIKTIVISRQAITLCIYLAVALLYTWPLLANLTSRLPVGSEEAATVPLFNLWTLNWNADRIADLYSGYWDAPIFFPQAMAFGLSDPMPFTGIMFAGLRLVTSNPFLSYNLCLLAILVLNGAAAARLATTAGVDRTAAMLVGVLAVSLPWVANELGVLQVTVLFPVLFALSYLICFLGDPSTRSGAAIGLWMAVAYLSSTYFGVILSMFIVASAALLVGRRHCNLTTAWKLTPGVLLYVLLLLPVITGQLESTENFHRNQASMSIGSAVPEHFFKLRSRSSEAGLLPWIDNGPFIDHSSAPQHLYPGTAFLVLAIAGMFVGWRSHKRRRLTVCFALFAALACALSFGSRLSLFDMAPYEVLRTLHPGFSHMRNVYRYAAFMQVGMLVLAGLALDALWRRRDRIGYGLTVTIVVASLAELLPPEPRFSPDRSYVYGPSWIARIRELPPGPLAYLPPSPGPRSIDYEAEVVTMLRGLEFNKPLLNGYSGYFPRHHRKFRRKLRDPTAADIGYLRRHNTRYVLLDRERATESAQVLFARQQGLQLLFETEKVAIYELR